MVFTVAFLRNYYPCAYETTRSVAGEEPVVILQMVAGLRDLGVCEPAGPIKRLAQCTP